MTQTAAQLELPLAPLTQKAFDAFCDDITSMFGNVAQCTAYRDGSGALNELKKEFKKLASVNHVQASGTLDGAFHLMLDHAGLFVLAGVFVMLPEKRINETIRVGTLKDADYINDAIKEVGNLLVGSWDRIFREDLAGHKHFKQTGTFVGSLWDDTTQSVDMAADAPCRFVICKIKVDAFPEFCCAAVFPEAIFEPKPVSVEPTASSEPREEKPQEKPDAPAASAVAATDTAVGADVSAPQKPAVQAAASVSVPLTVSTESAPGPVAQAIRQLTQSPPLVTPSADLWSLTAFDVMHQGVLWLSSEDTIEEASRQMQQRNVGYALVGQDGRIEGILSRSDTVAAVSPYLRSAFAQWRRPLDEATLKIRVKWFMSRPVHTIRPEATLLTVMEMMTRHGVRGLPVVDEKGVTAGLVTAYEVFGAILGGLGVSLTGRPPQAPPMMG